MRYFLMISLLGLGVSAFAADTNNMAERHLVGQHDVRFSCSFHTPKDKDVSCSAVGEVCVNFGAPPSFDASAPVERRCDNNRDDNKIVVQCSNGWEVDGRAFSRVVAEGNGDEDLFIASLGDRDDHRAAEVESEKFQRFDGDNDDKGLRFHSALRLIDGDNDRDDHLKFFGGCRYAIERDNMTELQ